MEEMKKAIKGALKVQAPDGLSKFFQHEAIDDIK